MKIQLSSMKCEKKCEPWQSTSFSYIEHSSQHSPSIVKAHRSPGKVKRHCKSFMRWAWVIFCIFGCGYQSYMMIELFFEDAMVAVSAQEFPTEIYPPAFSFCFQIPDILRADRLPKKSLSYCQHKHNGSGPLSKAKLRAQKINCLKLITENVTSEDLLDRLTYGFKEIVDRIDYLNPVDFKEKNISGSHALQVFANSSVESFFTYGRNKCFKINLLAAFDVKFYDRFELKMNDFLAPFLQIKFKEYGVSRVKRLFLFIHANSTIPRNQHQRVVLAEKSVYRLSYVPTIRQHTERRFYQVCKDYKTLGDFESREHFLSLCMKEMVDEGTVSTKAYRLCSEKEPLPDCYLQRYTPKMLDCDRSGDILTIGFVLGEQQQRVTFEQKISTSEFVVYMSGIIGIWFGFNFLSCWSQIRLIIGRRDVQELEDAFEPPQELDNFETVFYSLNEDYHQEKVNPYSFKI